MVTTELGAQARNFLGTTCEAYVTHELPQEENRRIRRHAKKQSTQKSAVGAMSSEKKRKYWNLNTYKWHSFGDYPDTIVDVGTTDSYSTQIVSTELLFVRAVLDSWLRASSGTSSQKRSTKKPTSATSSGRSHATSDVGVYCALSSDAWTGRLVHQPRPTRHPNPKQKCTAPEKLWLPTTIFYPEPLHGSTTTYLSQSGLGRMPWTCPMIFLRIPHWR